MIELTQEELDEIPSIATVRFMPLVGAKYKRLKHRDLQDWQVGVVTVSTNFGWFDLDWDDVEIKTV